MLVYATDNEPGDPDFDKGVRKLAEGADILIYDAQYLPEEYEAHRRGWGHSHWREAVNVVMESGAKELILYHHDPDHSDTIVDKVVADARNYYPKVRGAAEGWRRAVGHPPHIFLSCFSKIFILKDLPVWDRTLSAKLRAERT